jgi:REP element-mobilizing transposase RayT
MANTYSQIYLQTVFAVEGRLSLIRPEFKKDLYKYITGIVTNQGQKLISINGMSEHVHILNWAKASDGPGQSCSGDQGRFNQFHQ